MENQELQTIEAIENDPIYRYLSVPHALLRDESISPQCRWLIMYLLSNKEGWKVKVTQIVNHLKPHLGRKKVYDMFKEAIEAGYMKREDVIITNLRRGVKYIIASTPVFKKSFRHSNFGDAGARNAEIRHDKEIPSVKKDHIEEQQQEPSAPQALPAAAVFSCILEEKRLKKSDYTFLMKYSEEEVKKAIKIAQDLDFRGEIIKTFSATVKWAVKKKPEMSKPIDIEENKRFAQSLEDKWVSEYFTLESLTKYAIVLPKSGQMNAIILEYNIANFQEKLLELLKEKQFKLTDLT